MTARFEFSDEIPSVSFIPVSISCYGCGRTVTVMQHVAATSMTAAACADCRKKWEEQAKEATT